MTKELMILRQEDLITNPTTRLPVCLCLDVSGSMSGKPICELQKGVEYFFEAIKSDEIARYSVELSIVTFGSTADVILDFANVDRQQIPTLEIEGSTNMEAGVNLALDILEKRKKEYSAKGVDYYQPWLVVMTDGYPDSTPVSSINRVKQLGSNKKLTVFSVAIGDGADKTILKQFSTIKDGMVFKVKAPEHFKEYFEWLSQSVLVASQSVPGDKPRLPQPSTVIEIEL